MQLSLISLGQISSMKREKIKHHFFLKTGSPWLTPERISRREKRVKIIDKGFSVSDVGLSESAGLSGHSLALMLAWLCRAVCVFLITII